MTGARTYPICLVLAVLCARLGVAQEAALFFPPPDAPPAGAADFAETVFADPPDDPRFASMQAQIDSLLQAESDRKEAAAKRPTVRIASQVQPDFYYFNQDDTNRAAVGNIENGVAFRRARIGVVGAYGPSEYRVEFDWALSNRPNFLDTWAGLKDVAGIDAIRVGHFFEPFSLERYTPNRYTVFMERSLIDQPFAPARNTGIIAIDQMPDEMGVWAVGVFRANSNGFGDDVGDGGEFAGTGRVTRLLWYDDSGNSLRLLHLGAAYSYRDADNNTSRFRSQPEARVGSATPNVPFFVDTGTIPTDDHQLIGLEFAWVQGPLSVQSEYACAPVNTIAAPDLFMHGWYAQASYFLTGEHRPYNRSKGVFGRVIPRNDVIPADRCFTRPEGCGAWEVATRVSHLDFNDENVQGGRITDVTVAVNWYLNPYLHATFNYVHAFLDDPATGDSGADIFGSRVSFDF